MAGNNYFTGIREDVGNMIGEIGTVCSVKVPANVTDAFGNLVSKTYTTYYETIWCRPLNENLDIEGVGQFNKEDLRFIAPYNTNIVVEAKITFNGTDYFVLTIDKPDISGNTTHRVGFAKKVLS